VQVGGTITNHSYSFRAGGLDSDFLSPADIVTAFSYCYSGCGLPSSSSHNLGNVRTFITTKWSDKFDSNSNPCTACHNPHMVIGDPANRPSEGKSSGTRGYSPVSLPSLHSKVTSDWGLWGDVSAERMDVKASSYIPSGYYQAPKNGSSSYEPDGSSPGDGSNLTDFVTFCTDCHANTGINTSHSLFNPDPSPGQYPYPEGSMGRTTLNKIEWENEQHGGYQAFTVLGCYSDQGGYLLANPYTNCGEKNYVLSCTDCHEPHGSPNNYLVRRRQ
jgi:cytochrome c553